MMGLAVISLVSTNADAAENQNGGQVATDGIITFYDEVKEPTVSSSSEPKITKPIGRLPSTGEVIKGTVALGGCALIVIVLFLFFKRRKKEEEADQ